MAIKPIDQLFKDALEAGRKRDYNTAVAVLTEIITNYDYPPKVLLYLGRSYHALGDFNRAIAVYEFFLKVNPDSLSGHFFLGRTYLALGLFKRAVQYLKPVLDIKNSPYYFPALSFIGLAFLKARKPEIAVTYFEDALKYDPQNRNIMNGYLNALLIKAIKLFQRNALHDAAEIFEYLIKHKQGNILPHIYLARIYRFLGDNKQALYHYDIASRMSPDDEFLKLQKAVTLLKIGNRSDAQKEMANFQLHFDQGNVLTNDPHRLLRFITMSHFKKGEFRKAIDYGKEILKENYGDIEIHAVIAESYKKLGDLGKAKNHYLRAIEREKNKSELYYGLASILWELEEHEELLHIIKRIQRINPEDRIASYFYALCLSEIGENSQDILKLLQDQIRIHGPDINLMKALSMAYLEVDLPDLAESWLLRILKLEPEDKLALELLIDVYQRLNENKKAKKAFAAYCKVFPDDIETRKEYVKLLLKLNNNGMAIKELLCLIPLVKNNEGLKKTLGNCYIKMEKFEEATLLFRELLRGKPDSLEYLRALIFCLENTNRRKYAIELLKKALRFFKDNTNIHLILGVLYGRNKDYEPAIASFREVIAKYPKHWQAYKNLGTIYRKMGNRAFAEKFFRRAEEYRNNN
ncbi:MAG: tetratricopeptide repeat protein [Spirochaetales bacterium]|nr:tetratricopeptide repeat protein [Spirochaetales bacterium]